MAAEDDGKTEEATGKKLGDARNKGMVGKSGDFSSSVVLLAGVAMIWMFSDRLVGGMRNTMVESFMAIGNFEQIPGMIFSLARQGLVGILMLILPVVCGITVVSLAVSVAQVGFLWTWEPLGPHFGKVFSLSGLSKLFSAASFVEIAKSILKMVIVGVVAYQAVAHHYEKYLELADMSLGQFCSMMWSVSLEVILKSTVVLLFLGLADLVYQKRKMKKELMMSKTEVKDEAKQSEGDPHVKGKIKSLRMQMHRNFMMKELPKATVVITNPTFIAIAIRYAQGVDATPVVVAKGKRLIAERIRDVARKHDIPIVEDKPLARSLYDIVEPGEEIPEEFFAAVAEILAYVYSLKGQRVA
ncbi:MAG TPA: flagellar biosynthesis protein FlhB [Fibrobacteria bacterium]|nr:flagellar biosynthesis protein FlhB [Fibrobacteria bacterium]